MASDHTGNTVPEITQEEHLTEGSFNAKKAASYVWDASAGSWGRLAKSLTPGTDYDYIDVQQTSATVDTYVFKDGGSGGTTVQTITITFTSSAKTDIDTVVWS